MTREIVLRPAARSDLIKIWGHGTSRWGVNRTEAYLNGLGELLQLLAEHPEIGRLHEELRPPLRMHPYVSHLVLYRADVTLEVLRVPAMRSNWRGLLID